jgi:hypothetical protein
MFNALLLLENAGIVASMILGTGTAVCGVVLVGKMALSLTSASALASPPTRVRAAMPNKKRASPSDVYGAIYCAVLEAEVSEAHSTTVDSATSDALPVFAKPAKALYIDAAPLSANAA